MKKKIIKKNIKQDAKPTKSKMWVWLLIAFLLGGVIGYATHYTIINWNGFFATCPNGESPDKNGCCAGETYTDAGDGWMVCCPEKGDNCFPPVK
jgi:hypothetical protein